LRVVTFEKLVYKVAEINIRNSGNHSLNQFIRLAEVTKKILKMIPIKELITEIQSRGIRVPETILGRSSGAGPAEGRAFLIGGIPVNVPISAAYTLDSPFTLADEDCGRYMLLKHGHPVVSIAVVPTPRFYPQVDASAVPYKKIALLHGSDCLATTVLQNCVNWKNDERCAFCATQISLEKNTTIARKTPGQLAEVARSAAETDGVEHVVLTSGTGDPPGSEIAYLAECAAAVKAAAGLPVHVQFLPPDDLDLMDRLKAAGVDTVGIHIETFDMQTLRRVAPAKARIGLRRYETAWRRAVGLFGPNQVSSFLIVGLGEPPDAVVSGSEVLADLGVYPFVVPLRPIPGSWLQHHRPPDPGLMGQIYSAVANVLSRKGLSAQRNLAGCVRCGACSAMRHYERPCDQIVYHTARTEDEKSRALEIRHAVFVEEQRLFIESDLDEHDRAAILLVARKNDRIIGTVRIFPDASQGSGHWIGGRLAVHRDFRVFRVGAGLVREAMRRVKKRGCTVFSAHIQEKNVRFFQKLGWAAVGPMEIYCGHPHQLMLADLSRVPADFDEDCLNDEHQEVNLSCLNRGVLGEPSACKVF
jgi:radical SAM protein (TIGR04043 family)/putative N-acetyltransferase (TIGR04045 family)